MWYLRYRERICREGAENRNAPENLVWAERFREAAEATLATGKAVEVPSAKY